MSDYINALHDKQRRAFEAQEAIIARGPMDAESQAEFDRLQVELEEATAELKRHETFERNKREADIAREAYEPFIRPTADGNSPTPENGLSRLERFLRGDNSAATSVDEGRVGFDIDLSRAAKEKALLRAGADPKELRSILIDGGASGGSLVVPDEMARTIYEYLEAAGAVRQNATVMQSSNGSPWELPRVNTHGVATQVIASGTAIGGTDPIFDTITLNAYKFGQLVQVANEMVTDSAFDIIGFVTSNVGRAVGRRVATGYATGSGSSTINGLFTAASTGKLTGGSLITVDAEDLIDLQHSVVQEYRDNGVYIMLDATLGTLRKLRADGGGTIGPWLLEPPSAPGQPMGLFGRPVFTDFNVAASGSNAKSVGFGDVSRYYIKDSGAFRLERSDDYAFNTDLVSFRGVLRTDGDLIDTNAFKVVRENVA